MQIAHTKKLYSIHSDKVAPLTRGFVPVTPLAPAAMTGVEYAFCVD